MNMAAKVLGFAKLMVAAMSDVRRFDFDVTGCQVEDPLGGYVDHDDYAKLEAEAQALRGELANECKIAAFWNEQAEKYKAEAEALRARVVVVPDSILPHRERSSVDPGFNEALRQVAHLNGKVVSEGLLRRILERLRKAQIFDMSSELERALLGEGKEHE